MSTSYANKNVLIASATAGIGRAIALNLARKGANITIAARSESRANQVISELRSASPSPDAIFDFILYDATSIASTKSLVSTAQTKFNERGGLDLLFLTTGGLSNGVRETTAEGHEKYLSVAIFSRYIIAAGLLPQLKSRNGSVWTILAAGQGAAFDIDDIELAKPKAYSTFSVANRDGAITDITTLEFAKRHPEVWYNHVYPGFVKTDLAANNNLGFLLKIIIGFVGMFLAWSPEAYAEQLIKTIEEGDKSQHFWHAKSKKVTPIAWAQDEGVSKKVMEKLEEATGVTI